MTADEIASIIENAAAKHGVPTDALMAIANLESTGNINADNPRSSASGLFQFVDSTAREYGLTGSKRNDPAAQADAAARMMSTNARSLERTLGRPANAGELYLAHQQGLTGARALLTNPNRPAVDVLTDVYGSRDRAQKAVALNGGNLNQSAGQFAGQWVNKANQRASLIPPGSIPNTVATARDVTPPRPVAPTTPSTMPAMLAAQRNLQPVTQDTASLYAGIYPPTPPRAPITDKDLIFDRGISDTVERSQAGQNRDLGAALGTYAQGKRAPSPMSYAAADRGPRSIANVPLPRPRPENLFGMNGDPGTPAQGTFVPLTPPTPRQLPPLPPAARDTAPRMSTAQIRADNGQQGNRPNLFGMNGDLGTPAQGTQVAFTPSGVGLPPATRSVPSVPVPAPRATGMTTDRGAMPTRTGFLSEFGLSDPRETIAAPLPATPLPGPSRVGTNERLGPSVGASATAAGLGQLFPPTPDFAVASALDVVPSAVRMPIAPGLPPLPDPRPLRSGVYVQMPTPMGQRPTLPMPSRSIFAMPTPVAQRPNQNALRVTVNGAGSYSAPSRAPTPTREQQIAAILARSRGPAAFGGGGTIDGAVQPIGTLTGRR